MKLLLVAPTIDSGDVGEAWVAFQWADHLSKRHEVTVLSYRKRGAPEIGPQLPHARVIEWVEPALIGRLERFNSLLKPGYFTFARKARRWIRGAIAGGQRFDLAHQVVPVAMRYPSPLRGGPLPYVIGPVGGSLESPVGFRDEETGPWYQRLRRLDAWRIRYDPWLRATYERAACVIGIADYVSERLSGLHVKRLEILSETALPEAPAVQPREQVEATTSRPLRVLFVGRVIRTKGVRDLVAAMGRLRDVPVVVDIVGDGFDLAACQELVRAQGLSEGVRFHGRRSRAEVEQFYDRADVFAFPSYREPGGNVIFEAMGHWLPLIVCDRGGPSAAVNSECALILPAISPDQLAGDLADAIRRLAFDPELRGRMGVAARQRLLEVGLWGPKMDRVDEIYASVLST
ncbi:glycosyltransferase family 4 protein [Microbacterium sp. Leaf288]|uniref:glycosyltransferase family 4 protein n=1 Tax=Microbacterium sp. Leaf288 TaxID=1736323 RepID=UPI001F2EA0C2|nr:glycosyltransferase family 4 protein [Microbacterium sp. Leaf288]